MKAAFATWNNRIAPQFDAARHAYLIEARLGEITAEHLETFKNDLPIRKVLHLVELGVGILICGAISRPLHSILAAHGIRVIAFVSGDLREVIQAWMNDRLGDTCFAMPGNRVNDQAGEFGLPS